MIETLTQDQERMFVFLEAGSKYETLPGSELCLGIAEAGYFASSEWLESSEAFEQVTGRSFGIITGDDNTSYKEDKSKIRDWTDYKQINEHLNNCSDDFKERVNTILSK